MNPRILCTKEEWRDAYGTQKQLEIFQPVIDALQSSQPQEIDIGCCGTAMTPQDGTLLKMCVKFRRTDEHFCIYFDEYRDWGMFVKWSAKYLRMHGVAMIHLHSATYENLPEPVIYGLATEQRQDTEQRCRKLAQSLSPILAADAWI